jgi:hypothetical protein
MVADSIFRTGRATLTLACYTNEVDESTQGGSGLGRIMHPKMELDLSTKVGLVFELPVLVSGCFFESRKF